MKLNYLTPDEEKIIVQKGTEPPFTGKYDEFYKEGTYVCRRCGHPLYISNSKFHSGCGWPSFDQEIASTVKKSPDPDGLRTEISCASCEAHLGHVFVGEEYTPRNVRHCVNSLSLRFVPRAKNDPWETAVFGGGCFWCTEAVFRKLKGVKSVTPGYAGGQTANPTYKEVSTHQTGHAEVIKVEFDPSAIPYHDLLEIFFSSHDPTQLNRQGNDVGRQYRSAVFYTREEQKDTAEKMLKDLDQSGTYHRPIVTEIMKLDAFYPAEDYHQNYYEKNASQPYCQLVISPKLQELKAKYANKLKVL